MIFSDAEKIRLFDKIDELYFRRNFGSTSKSDLETLLFSEYIECCMCHNEPFDDYSLSKELGITQARIRSLKERKELKYPHNETDPDWWKRPFADSVKNAKYNENDHTIRFILQDINVMNEVRHFIEVSGWYDECSLNKKLLVLPLDCFVEVVIGCDSEMNLFTESQKRELKKLSKNHGELKDFAKDFSKDGLKRFLMVASKDAIGFVLQTLPLGGVAKLAFDHLAEAIIKTP